MLRTEGTYEFREAGITNVSVGTLHGQLDGKDGYRNSYYHWTDNSGKARFAAVCLEYVGGNSNGISVLSLQPLGWYGEGGRLVSALIDANGYVGGYATMIGGAAKQTNIAFNVVNEVRPFSPITKIANAGAVIGGVGFILNATNNYIQAEAGVYSKQEAWIRTGVSFVEFGLAFVPYVGPFLSVAVIAYDLGGGFDDNLYSIGKP